MTDPETPKKELCPDCGGTGLKDDPENGSALCECPVGRRRTAAIHAAWDL